MMKKTLYSMISIHLILLCCLLSPLLAVQTPRLESSSGSITFLNATSEKTFPAWRTFLSVFPGKWMVSTTGEGLLSYATVSQGPFVGSEPVQILQFVQRVGATIGIEERVLSSLYLESTRQTPGGTYYTYQARVHGLPQFLSTLTISINEQGELVSIRNELQSLCELPVLPKIQWEPIVRNLEHTSGFTFLGKQKMVLYHASDGTCYVALQCFGTLPQPGYRNPLEALCLISTDGKIIFRKNLNVPYRRDR